MSTKRSATVSLTIYLLKSAYRTGASALKKPNLTVDRIPGVGELYTEASFPHPPKWMSFFGGSLPPARKLINSSSAGVLFVECASRIFAVTFGQGKNLLAPDAREEGFGLRVTLNSIDPHKIKSMDHKTFEAVTRHSRTQTSREGSTDDFGLNIERDLVRAVTGEPRDQALGRRLTGMDALVAVANVNLMSLPSLLQRYLDQFTAQNYKTHFPWIDNISEVRDPGLKAQLDAKLVDRIKSASLNRLWLSTPDIVDWSKIGGFKYLRTDAVVQPDLDIHDFLRSVRDPSTMTVGFLRSRRILVMDAEGDITVDEWPVYQCIYYEEDHGPDTFLLSTGNWYRIEKHFVVEVNNAVANLVSKKPALPQYTTSDRDEGAYNQRVAAGSNGALVAMDNKKIMHGGGHSSFEFCDLYSGGGDIIHVKRYGKASSPISHLCMQALNSAQLWLGDAEFRKKVNALLPKSHQVPDPSKPPDTAQYSIVVAVVSPSNDPIDKSLPFFSRLAIRNTARQLAMLGYPVSLLKIEQR